MAWALQLFAESNDFSISRFRMATYPKPEIDETLRGSMPVPVIQRSQSTGVTLGWLAWRHRSSMLRAAGIGVVLSVALAFLLPNQYESTVALMPPDQNSGTAAMLGALTTKTGGSLGALAGSMLNLSSSAEVVVGILHSRSVEDEIIDKFDLRKIYWCKRYVDTRRILEKRSNVSEDRKSGIITITVTDGDPVRASQIAQSYVDALNRRVALLTTTAAHRERVFLEGRLSDVKQELDSSSTQLSQFSSKNRTMDLQTQGHAMLEAGANLQGQLIAAEADLRSLQQLYTPDNPRVRSASARVNDLRAHLSSLIGAEPDARKAGTPASRDELSPSLTELPLLGNTYADLYRRTRILEATYEALSQEYEVAKVEEAKEIPSIKVLDAPVIPEKKSWPPRAIIILIGTFAALGICLLWFAMKQAWAELDPETPWRKLVVEALGPNGTDGDETAAQCQLQAKH